jgi:hypothetical protein
MVFLVKHPTLFDMRAPRLRAYSRYTVVAEKFSAMVELGMTNIRVRDYCDIWALRVTSSLTATCSGQRLMPPLVGAMPRLRPRVRTVFPTPMRTARCVSGRRFSRGVYQQSGLTLSEAIAGIRAFLEPVVDGQARGQVWRQRKG